MKVIKVSKEIIARAYARSGYVQWTVKATAEIAGVEFFAAIEVSPEDTAVVWFEPNDLSYEFDVAKNDDTMVLSKDGEVVWSTPSDEWFATQVTDAKEFANKVVSKIEENERAYVAALISGEEEV
jgi:hypothetical protein